MVYHRERIQIKISYRESASAQEKYKHILSLWNPRLLLHSWHQCVKIYTEKLTQGLAQFLLGFDYIWPAWLTFL